MATSADQDQVLVDVPSQQAEPSPASPKGNLKKRLLIAFAVCAVITGIIVGAVVGKTLASFQDDYSLTGHLSSNEITVLLA
jgi:hypothetical protein